MTVRIQGILRKYDGYPEAKDCAWAMSKRLVFRCHSVDNPLPTVGEFACHDITTERGNVLTFMCEADSISPSKQWASGKLHYWHWGKPSSRHKNS